MQDLPKRLLQRFLVIAAGRGIVFLFVLLGARCSSRTTQASASASERAADLDSNASAARAREAHLAQCESVRQACLADRPAAHGDARYAKWYSCELEYSDCSAAQVPASATGPM